MRPLIKKDISGGQHKEPFELYSESTIIKFPFGLIGPQSSDSPNACNISWKLVVILLF